MKPADSVQDVLDLVRAADGHPPYEGTATTLLAKYKVNGASGAMVGALLGLAVSWGRDVARERDCTLEELLDDVTFNVMALVAENELE